MTSLSGITVLDFSHALAGPYCTLLLAQHGADIYKVESADGGDPGRGWGPPFVGDQSSYFAGLNQGKRSISINLKLQTWMMIRSTWKHEKSGAHLVER